MSPKPWRGLTPWTRRSTCRRSGCTRCGEGPLPASPLCPPRLAGGPHSTDKRTGLSREGFDHRFAEFVERFRDGEIGEPDIEPLDALVSQAGEMSDQLVGVSAHQSGAEIAEPPGAHLSHGVGVAVLANEAHHLLNRHPSGPGGGGQPRQPIEMVGRYVPPIRVSANKFHHPAPGSAEDQRYPMLGTWRLSALRRLVTPPVLHEQAEMALELLDPGNRILLTDIESGEFSGPRAGPEAELESAVRGL